MRNRYRIYACPEDGCPVASLVKTESKCKTHGKGLIEKIVRREDAPLTPQQAAEAMKKAADAVSQSAGNGPGPMDGVMSELAKLQDMFKKP